VFGPEDARLVQTRAETAIRRRGQHQPISSVEQLGTSWILNSGDRTINPDRTFLCAFMAACWMPATPSPRT